MKRRLFLKFLGLGAAAASAPSVISAESAAPPERAVELPMGCFWFENGTELRLLMEDGSLNIYRLSTEWDMSSAEFAGGHKTPRSIELEGRSKRERNL